MNQPVDPQNQTVNEDLANNASFVNNNPADKAIPPHEDDPMIAEMRAAEKQMEDEAKAAESGETAPKADTGAQNPGNLAENGQTPAATPANAEAEAGSPMIPKARFDEVLRERDEARNTSAYLQGVVGVQTKMIGVPATAAAPGTTAAPAHAAEPTFDQKIEAAENKKIELATKYEAGDIGTVDYEKQRIAIDRDIRSLSDERHMAAVNEVKNTATAQTNAQLVESQVNQAALNVQQNFPYVAEIDKLPPAIRDGVWKQIDLEAQNLLLQKGINARDGSPQSRIALMNQKAELTEKYGPQYTGKTPEQVKGTQPGVVTPQTAPSTQAADRKAKLELATNQPPAASDLGTSGVTNELTETQLANLDQDEIADLLAKMPNAVQRAAGM